jgi:hypothetical protein
MPPNNIIPFPTRPTGKAKPHGPTHQVRELAIDLPQLALDLAGIAGPTPVSDGASALLSIDRGRKP